MAHVGGVFLASPDPERLIAWFQDRFGWAMESNGDGAYLPFPGESTSVIGIMPAAPDAPSLPDGDAVQQPYGRQPMMCNLAVDDLEAVVARLRAAGDDVAGPTTFEDMGEFAWTRTPDGHDIELWQPA